MSEETCRRIAAETYVDASRRCRRFEDECPECACEHFSFGNGSPGMVASDETLVRFHFSPHDIDEDGRPTPMAFTDVDSIGLSVTRDGCTDAEIERAMADRIAASGWGLTWHSVSLIPTREVRKLYRTQQGKKPERCFCVYDTAEEGNRMHAEICGTRAGRKFRKHLRDLCSLVLRGEYRGGALKPEAHLPPNAAGSISGNQ
jgi:hypothetical protein